VIDPPEHLLFVCTANICRSPVAELLLRHRLQDTSRTRVSSAGVRAHPDLPIDPRMARMLAADGVVAGGFRATDVDAAVLDRASLIVTMTRRHRSTLVGRDPQVLARTFTLVELAALLAETGPADSLAEYAARRPLLSVTTDQLDVVDPYKQRRRVYARTYDQIRASVATIADVLYERRGAHQP
jgi:protein-tyrosine phosphatase